MTLTNFIKILSCLKGMITTKKNTRYRDFINFWGLSDSLTDEDINNALLIVSKVLKNLIYYNVFSSIIAMFSYTQYPKITFFLYVFSNLFLTLYFIEFKVLHIFKKEKLKKRALFNESTILSKSNALIKSIISGILFTSIMEGYFLLMGKNQMNQILSPSILKRISLETGLTIIFYYFMIRAMTIAQKNQKF